MSLAAAIEPLLGRWGPWAVLLGAAIEGESVVVAGGALAARGLMQPWSAGAAAALGSFLADQLCFWLGRRSQGGRIVRWAEGKATFARAVAFIDRYPTGFVLAFRFVYGFRIAGPIAIGVSHVPAARFLLLNALSAAVWAALFTVLGYAFGHTIERTVERVGWPVLGVVVVALLLGAGAWWLVRRRHGGRLSEGGARVVSGV